MTTAQRRELHAALLSAFPTNDALEELVFLATGVSLDTITIDGTLSQRVAALIKWAESTGGVDELVVEAKLKNPTNPDLVAYASRWASSSPTPRDEVPAVRSRVASLMPQDFDQFIYLMNFAIGWFAILGLICAHLLGYISIGSVALVLSMLLGAVWIFRRLPSRQ